MKKIKNIFWVLACIVLSGPTIVFSGTSGGGGNTPSATTLPNPLGNTDLTTLIENILSVVKKLGGIAVIFFIIYAGYLFVTAQGNEQKLEEAKKTLLYTVIGALIILGVEVIQAVIKGTLTDLGVKF